ncbi:MAG: hypothetical protein ACKVQB_05650, partial [Bacteroidia bacterium]
NTNKYKIYGHFIGTDHSNVKKTQTGIGMQPFTGFNIYPSEQWVISFESSVLVGINTIKDSRNTNHVLFGQPTHAEKPWVSYGQLFFLRTASIGWRF